MNHQGKITISRTSSTRSEQDEILIRVYDNKSGTEFIEVALTPELFAMAVTGLARQDCTFDIDTSKVGKVKEVKTVQVYADSLLFVSDEEKIEILAPHRVDGWEPNNLGDLGNHHRLTGRNTYNVTMVRWVEE